MSELQFRFLLPQLILGFLASWKLYSTKAYLPEVPRWYHFVFWIIFFQLPLNYLIWGHTFAGIILNDSLSLVHISMTTSLTLLLMNMDAWLISGVRKSTLPVSKRMLWSVATLFVGVIVFINSVLFVYESRNISRAKDLKLEITQLKHKRAQMLAEDEQR